MDPSKRRFLKRSVVLLGASGLVTSGSKEVGAFEPPDVPPWMKSPGAGFNEYGVPSKHESKVTRTLIRSQPGTTGSGAARTPLEALDGTLTPSGLHFERSHSGVPDINPDKHRLLIHGMVKRPLIFTIDALLRYPVVPRIHFLECSGNSQFLYQPTPPSLTAGQTHGLVSCSEWTGVPLRLLLEEAGVDPGAPWILAEGADAAAMSRSVPMAKAMDDAMLALFQNGERLRPENGYPVRLFLPGCEVTSAGGRTWTAAPLSPLVLAGALTRFRLPWRWDGSASVLKSRATDDTGAVQPERDRFIADHGNNAIFHCNAIQAWGVAANGEVKHVYA